MRARSILLAAALVISSMVVSDGQAIELKPSPLDLELHKIRFESPTLALQQSGDVGSDASGTSATVRAPRRKSPLKAFVLSAVIPGAGQFYNGSKIKAVGFLGLDVLAGVLHFKYKGDGDDATDDFEAYNELYWSRETYAHYLNLAYHETDDDLINATEVSHHLPDENTQQYYEMTGKYDQFAWGWDDALRDGMTLDEFAVDHQGILPITNPAATPVSQHRMIYEDMRYQANQYYDKADTWLVVMIVNHVVSSFEAFFSAKKHNNNLSTYDPEFTKVDVKMSLKSTYTFRDTPYLKLSYKF